MSPDVDYSFLEVSTTVQQRRSLITYSIPSSLSFQLIIFIASYYMIV